jgi:hypothetical protein
MAEETWLPWCERIDGPRWKQGYPGIPNRTLNDIEGEVKHSAEGPFSALLAEINHATRTASWTFSIREDGHTVQHYPLEAITWHCGVEGDFDTITDLIGNLTLAGEEYAGKKGTALTASQNNASLRISRDIRRLTPTGLLPAELKVNLWEHGWLSVTSCPNDRVDWPLHLAALNLKEIELTEEQLRAIFIDVLENAPLEKLQNRSLAQFVQDSDDYIIGEVNRHTAAEIEAQLEELLESLVGGDGKHTHAD